MIHPIKFPNHYDVIREETERHLKRTCLEKFLISSDMMAFGKHGIDANPNRERVLQLQLNYENEWQKAQRQIMNRYEAHHGLSQRQPGASS